MLTVFNEAHRAHQGRQEMFRGRLVACPETPARGEHVLAELQRRRLGTVRALSSDIDDLDMALARIHTPDYLRFLAGAWQEWLSMDPSNAARDALPSVWPAQGMRRDRAPANFAARLGLYGFDAGTPLTAGTWEAARGGASCAVAAAHEVAEGPERCAFALTRPPGHHAGGDFFGGYCFLNNAALAAQALRDNGEQRVAILDIDFHHGNGTQSIFEARDDVLTVSVHGDPITEYPYFIGHADERGHGPGTGFNLNLPLPRGADFQTWRAALGLGLQRVRSFDPQALVVSLGVDTFENDPISGFRLRTADFLTTGHDLSRLNLPTVFVFEGGYAVDEIGINVANVLEGFIG